jgi:hypothetical protein
MQVLSHKASGVDGTGIDGCGLCIPTQMGPGQSTSAVDERSRICRPQKLHLRHGLGETRVPAKLVDGEAHHIGRNLLLLREIDVGLEGKGRDAQDRLGVVQKVPDARRGVLGSTSLAGIDSELAGCRVGSNQRAQVFCGESASLKGGQCGVASSIGRYELARRRC